jgi:hypothetical protein
MGEAVATSVYIHNRVLDKQVQMPHLKIFNMTKPWPHRLLDAPPTHKYQENAWFTWDPKKGKKYTMVGYDSHQTTTDYMMKHKNRHHPLNVSLVRGKHRLIHCT